MDFSTSSANVVQGTNEETQKHFMDIARLKEFDVVLEDGTIIPNNANGFKVGDIVSVQEKIDGSNASIQYDVKTKKLKAFSRKQTLSYDKTLNGFWNYVQSLNPNEFKDTPNYVVFGEWMTKNHIVYTSDVYHRWIVYDIYNIETEQWLEQNMVKAFCEFHNLEYIHVLYTGEFTSWDDLRERFAEKTSTYCNVEAEGFIVKNMSEINNPDSRLPFVLKLVNDSYKEINLKNHISKIEDPQKLEEKAHALEIAEQIITKRRVEKELLKMRDEGILPNELTPQDMKIVAKNLPMRIYNDCIKEENEFVIEAGQYFGKTCNMLSMKYAKEIILGSS